MKREITMDVDELAEELAKHEMVLMEPPKLDAQGLGPGHGGQAPDVNGRSPARHRLRDHLQALVVDGQARRAGHGADPVRDPYTSLPEPIELDQSPRPTEGQLSMDLSSRTIEQAERYERMHGPVPADDRPSASDLHDDDCVTPEMASDAGDGRLSMPPVTAADFEPAGGFQRTSDGIPF